MMKTILVEILPCFNRNLGNRMKPAPSLCRLFAILLMIAGFGLLPGVQAVSPAPDGCYPNFTTAEGCNALQNLVGGAGNSGLGWYALFSTVEGSFNTGVGGGALVLNTGDSNTAVGAAAGLLNTSGTLNTAVGTDAMVFNDIGDDNTAVGAFALEDNVGSVTNVAVGTFAAQNNDSSGTGAADFNVAVGGFALQANIEGTRNTAVGAGAMESADGGNDNTAVGELAGNVLGGGSGNTCIGKSAGTVPPMSGEYNNTILLGIPGDDDANSPNGRTYIGNIRDVATGNLDAVAVLIDSDGQLGTINSSRRFKKDITPMNQTSEAILALKPVTFHYKDGDTKKAKETSQFGLIAEEVEKVNRDLVVYGKDGKIWSVRYDAVNAMLLNEFLKEHKKVEEQQNNITQLNIKMANQLAINAQQQKGIEVLTTQLKEQAAQIQKVSAQLQLNKSATTAVASGQ